MGFLYKHIIHPILSGCIGRKAFTNDPYMGMVLDADESDLIADELFRVALRYRDGGYMLPQDTKKAKKYMRKAADRGHCVAQVFMSMIEMEYENDHNDRVMYWLQKAAEQGERQATFNLGICYHRGDIDGKVDIQKSNELFRQSAEADYNAAYSRMALIYYNGEGVEKNLKIAKYWAWLDFANTPEQFRDQSVLNVMIEKEDVDAQNHLRFKKIIEDAADAGERDAINNRATGLHNTGEKEKGINLWRKAADMGHPIAMVNLAHQYWTEEVKEYEKARLLFEEALKSGNENAYYGLAVIYSNGLGVEKDISKAWSYLEKALNKGLTPARYLFAYLHVQNEIQTILPDKVLRGSYYLEQAAQEGYEPATALLKQMIPGDR